MGRPWSRGHVSPALRPPQRQPGTGWWPLSRHAADRALLLQSGFSEGSSGRQAGLGNEAAPAARDQGRHIAERTATDWRATAPWKSAAWLAPTLENAAAFFMPVNSPKPVCRVHHHRQHLTSRCPRIARKAPCFGIRAFRRSTTATAGAMCWSISMLLSSGTPTATRPPGCL